MESSSAQFYEDLLAKALQEIDRDLGGSAVLVSAQMGVHGNPAVLEQNLATLSRIVLSLRGQGETVFDQLPWLDIHQEDAPRDYALKFEVFWKGLIQSGRIAKVMVPSESRGTRGVESEITYAIESGVEVIERKLEELLGGERG